MRIRSLITIVLCVFSYVSAEFVVPPAPTSGYILDEISLLDASQKQQLEQTLATLESETRHQIGIAIVKSLQGRPLEEASIAIARAWGVGQKGLDNGILILVAPNEREMRIEVGRGLEGVITDLTANRIIDEYMVPAFQREAYFEGLESAIRVMTPLLTGESVELPSPPVDIPGVIFILAFCLFYSGIFLGSAFFEPSKAWWPGFIIGTLIGGGVLWYMVGTMIATIIGMIVSGSILGGVDWLFSTGKIPVIKSRPGGGRWGSGGGFGGGGFGGSSGGGFGGGGFGGGGASGRW